jgi:hypothetical protein
MSIYLYDFFKINLDNRLIYPVIGKNKQTTNLNSLYLIELQHACASHHFADINDKL